MEAKSPEGLKYIKSFHNLISQVGGKHKEAEGFQRTRVASFSLEKEAYNLNLVISDPEFHA